MPAGDLLTNDDQVEIRSTLTGYGTPWLIDIVNMQGLGVPNAKARDVDLGHAHGTYLGRDYTGPRIITIPYVLRGTPATVGADFLTLCDLWESSETDIALHLQLAGFGHLSCNGRPRGLVDDLSALNFGAVRALATFVCGDPTLTVVP